MSRRRVPSTVTARAQSRDVSLPGGTVTFLFTDIEGSTRLLRRLGEQYTGLLRRHQQLLRTAVADNGGVEVGSEGDGLFFAFSGAKSALNACVTGQTALLAERWPEDVAVAVRMGVHTGEAAPDNGYYVALAVHQAARVAAAANGGQILVSQATAAAVSEALPASTSLRDLGEFVLKDFDAPTRLFQVCHPRLPAELARPRVSPLGETPSADAPIVSVPAVGTIPPPQRVMTPYRTDATPSGYFRTPGDIHVHIDGGRMVDILDLLKELGAPGKDGAAQFPGKFNHILRFSGGPQRDDRAFSETYRYHTPGSAQKEAFDSFSTIWLGTGGELGSPAVAALRRILESISGQPEAVVELERVIGVLESGAMWNEADPPRVADPRNLDTGPLGGFRRLTTSPVEIHHSIDFAKGRDTGEDNPVLSVDQLPTWPNLGGWFLFDKGDSWSYRSSEFVGRTGEYHYAACVGQKRLSDYLAELGHPYALHTLIEQVLGIWRGGEQPKDRRCSIPALGEWEMSCPPNGHVWVIASNFLGDRSPDVKRAMLENLAQDVTYTYFLDTHADVLRLGILTEELERGMAASGATADKARQTVAEKVRCVLLSPELSVDDRLQRLLRADYFLCPYDDHMGGYRLESSGLSGERMSSEDLEYIVAALNPLLESKIRGLFLSSEESWAPKSSYQAVVCTDFEETAVDQDQDPWQRMLAAYDRIVAREVSMHGKKCFVVRPVRNGYLLVFEDPREAAAWSRRLQFEVHRHNQVIAGRPGRALAIPNHNIVLGYGSISRVLRAHGYDYIGGAIDDCIDLAAKLHESLIAMSRRFADQYEGQVGKREFMASTTSHADPELGELRLLQWP